MRFFSRFACIIGFVACFTASAQVGEFSLSGGVSRFGDANLGTLGATVNSAASGHLKDGFRLTFRMTFNTYRFFGHEFVYAYNRSNIQLPGQDNPTTIHQILYDFLVYFTPEGARIRPFVAGGPHVSIFYPPGSSVYQGNGTNKFGLNYGGGIKFKVTDIIGIRFDVRDYNTGKPFGNVFSNQSGRLNQIEASVGAALLF